MGRGEWLGRQAARRCDSWVAQILSRAQKTANTLLCLGCYPAVSFSRVVRPNFICGLGATSPPLGGWPTKETRCSTRQSSAFGAVVARCVGGPRRGEVGRHAADCDLFCPNPIDFQSAVPSSARQRYHEAMERYGRQRSPCSSSSAGLGKSSRL